FFIILFHNNLLLNTYKGMLKDITLFCQIPPHVFDKLVLIYYYDCIQLKVEEITMNYDKNMINRINRVQGQLNGVVKMMEEEKHCKDFITQLSASKSSLRSEERRVGKDRI